MAEVANGNDTSNNNSENAIIYLKMLRDASNSLGLTVVIDYMERYTNPFEMLSKEVSPVFTFIGNLYKTVSGGKLHIKEYAGIFSGTLKMINSMIALYDGFQNNTKTGSDVSVFIAEFASTSASMESSIYKLNSVKSPLALPVVAASLGLIASTLSTMDGVSESDLRKIDKSTLGLIKAMGTTAANSYFPGNTATNAPLGPLALVMSVLSGFMTGWHSFKDTIKEYEDNGIPSELAVRDAVINLIANVIHGTATSWSSGADDAFFHFTQNLASWLTKTEISYKDKNYVEWIFDGLKSLNVSNTGTTGDDTLINDTNESYIYGEDGNDRISNFASGATIWGGSGKDTIFSHADWEGNKFNSNSLLGGLGDDFISALDMLTTILGGEGNDKLSSYGNRNRIFGEAGNDVILIGNGTSRNTISGGLGNDIIILDNAKDAVIEYDEGDGTDIIYGYEESDRINISTNYETSVSGDNVIIYVDTGLITVTGAANKAININGKKIGENQEDTSTSDNTLIVLPGFWDSNQIVRGISINDKINNTVNGVKINTTAGSDTITNSGSNVTIMSGADDDYVSNSGTRTLIDGGSGVDVIYNEASNVTINGGDGNDSIKNIGNNVLIEDDGGNDTITNSGNYVSINSDEDNDRITNSGDNVKVNAGNGNNYISNSGNNVTIVGGSTADTVVSSGNYVSINAGDGNNSISISSVSGGRNSIETGDGNDTINIADKNESSVSRFSNVIDAGNGNNYIYNNNVDLSTIYSEAGNDTIITSGGSVSSHNRTSIIAGDGDNKISVTTEMYGGRIYSGKGADYVTIVGNGSNNVVSVGGGDDTVVISGNSSTINMGSGNNHITLKADSKNNKIIAGKGDDYIMFENNSDNNTVSIVGGINSIVASNGRHTIVTGDDSDLVTMGSGYVNAGDGQNNISLISGDNRSSIITGKGNDTILLADTNETEDKRYHDIISAGDGDNYIYNSNVELSTISAGKGNDTIVTGGGIGYTSHYDKYDNYFTSSGTPHFTSISAGDGDNKITVNTVMSNGVILAGDGNDYVSIADNGANNVISIGGGNDSLISGIKSSNINLGSGNNQVTLQSGGGSNNIIAGSGNNFVTMASGNANNLISLGSGSNTVYGIGGWNSIVAGGGVDLVTIGSGYVNIGDGKNDISLTSGGYRSNIVTGKDDDTIRVADRDENADKRYHDIINAGEGNNYIYNSNVELSTIGAGKGNDTIVTGGGIGYTSHYDKYDNYFTSSGTPHFTSISAGDGDNKITVNTVMSNGVILAGDGNDYVTIAGNGSNDYISLGKGRNTIYSGNNNYNSITSGNGSDVIIAGGNSNSINAGSGRNYVSLTGGNNSTVITGGGNDTIVLAENSSGNVITFGGGNDLVQNYHSNDTIKSVGSITTSTVGNDVILTSGSDKMTLKGAKGKTINFTTIAATGIDTTVGDTLTSDISGQPQETLPPEETLDNSNLTYNEGKTAVTLTSNFTGTLNESDYVSTTRTIDATQVKGSVKIYGNSLSNNITGGKGADTLSGGKGNDTLTGGDGNDIFVHSYGRDIVADYVAGTDKIKIEDGEVFDYRVINSDVVLYTDNGSVRVKNGKGKKITVIDSEGNETSEIYSTTEVAKVPVETIPAGISIKGAVLTATTVFSGNKIDLADYAITVTKVNATALNSAVTIVGSSAGNSLAGGKKADTIYAGTGNDTVTGGDGNDVFVCEGGNDTITDYIAGQDKIKLTNSTITGASLNNSNVVLTTSTGSITIKNGKDKEITVIDSVGKETKNVYPIDTMPVGLTYDTKKTMLTASTKFTGNKIDLADYETTVTKVNASALSKVVEIDGNSSNNSLKGGKGTDTIYGNAGKDTILGGDGNDKIYGGADNDVLTGDAGNDTLYGGSGNDTLTGGKGNDVFVHEGGNDVITDYFTGENTLKLMNGTIASTSVKSSDVVLKTSGGSITVKNGKGKKITVTDGNGDTATEYYGLINYSADKKAITLSSAFNTSLTASDYATTVTKIDASAVAKSINIIGNAQNNTILGNSKAETIYGGAGNDSILGNAGNDKLYGDAGADSLNGGKGNDTLTGGDGNDVFFYASGEGNDIIADFTAGQDKINVTSGTIASASLKGSDMVFKMGSGTLTVKNGKNKEIAIGNSIYYNNLIYNTNKTEVTVGASFSGSLKSSDYASAVKTINASGVTKSTNIVGNSQDNTITGSAKAETIYGGAGNDSILGNAGNDKLYGDAGNDKLFGGAGNDTLNGGAGNNTLTGGNGKDVFAYEGGNDVITDYAAGQDTIKLTIGQITKTSYSGQNVIFSVGSGTITVQNGKDKKIAITDANNKTTTQTYTPDVEYTAARVSSYDIWFTADDNNFITDDIQISTIKKEPESNYVEGQTAIFTNKNELEINDSVVSASDFDKK